MQKIQVKRSSVSRSSLHIRAKSPLCFFCRYLFVKRTFLAAVQDEMLDVLSYKAEHTDGAMFNLAL